MKIFNVSSYNRINYLEKTINSIFDQSDKINISLNGNEEIPKSFVDKKINIIRTNNELGDAYKFFFLEKENGYYFTIDDDLIYPDNYSEYMIEKFNEYDRKCVITLHGRSFNRFPVDSYYRSPVMSCHCLREVIEDRKIQFGGTGVMCFHTDLFKISIDYFKHANMADVWIGKFCMENNIDIICVKHEENFLKYQNIPDNLTIHSNYKNKDKIQTQIVNSIKK